MDKFTTQTFFDTFALLRDSLPISEGVPLISSLLLLQTVLRFDDHYRSLGVTVPSTLAADLQELELPVERVAALVHEVLGDRVQIKVSLPTVNPLIVAQTARQLGRYVNLVAAGEEDSDVLSDLGQACTYLLDYIDRQKLTNGQQTPATLAQLTASLLDVRPGMTILDCSVGVARIFVEVARLQQAAGYDPNAICYVGQEMNIQVVALGAIHLLLNGVANFVIHFGNTLTDPATEMESFDRVVADPPMGLKVVTADNVLEGDRRFKFGPRNLPKTAEWLFVQHGLSALKPGGRGVFITPHGPLFRAGVEAAIRQNVLLAGWLNAVIALPSALYPVLALPVVMTIFDRPLPGQSGHGEVLMIDFSTQGTREGRHQILEDRVRSDLLSLVEQRTEQPDLAALVSHERIYANKDVWQPSQYLEREVSQTRSVTAIRQELAQMRMAVRQTESDLEEAFEALLQ